MARTESNEFEMGKKAPDFTLQNAVNNQWISLNEARGKKGTVILFICNHCPFVIHINQELVRIANEIQPKGIAFIAISSNDNANTGLTLGIYHHGVYFFNCTKVN